MMKSIEGNEKHQGCQPASVCSDVDHNYEDLSMKSLSSGNTEATAAYLIQQVCLWHLYTFVIARGVYCELQIA